MKKSIIGLSVAASFVMADGSYTLGVVSVQNSIENINPIEKTISSNTIVQNNERTVAETLDNVSGLSLSNTGARNETTLSIRGFDARRIGVFIDGIPVYVPYDGNFDYSRFLTNDISQIDISKGYSSVVYGANTMGGVINIISKKPTKELEGNLRAEMILDSDAKMARHLESINVGSKVDSFYAQLGGSYSKRDHFRLSDDYSAVVGSAQPEGERLRSETRDQKISLKAGYVTDDASEVAINYSNQKGQKEQPPSIDGKLATVRYWDWPYWDKETISISGQKNFDSSYVKAVAYFDKSKNSLFAYKDNTYSSFNNAGSTFKSRYDDYSYGMRLEYGLEAMDNFLKFAANYKKDVHRGYDISKTINSETMTERYKDHTLSLGAEDNYKITKELELLAGVSYDRLEGDEIFDTNRAYLNMLNLTSQSAINPQAALIYTLSYESKVRASVSQKSYMPSMKDRYSRKMGRSVPNVDLDKEVANHYELSYIYQANNISTATNIYYSKIKDAIQSVIFAPTLEQNQNVGDFEHKGSEFDIEYKNDSTKVGGNYAFVDVKNKMNSSIKRTGIPKHQIFAYTEQKLGSGFSLYTNAKFRDGVYEQITNLSYVEMASFTTFDTKLIYAYMDNLQLEAGIKNLTDKVIQYNVGFPEAGREYFATMNYKF